MFHYVHLLLMLACGAAYYRIGEVEYGKGFLLAAVSILVWIVTAYALGWQWLPSLCAQAGIFVVLTAVNVLRGPAASGPRPGPADRTDAAGDAQGREE